LNISAPAATIDRDVQTLEPHESREGERFEGGDLTDVDLSGISLMDRILDGVTLADTGLRGARFVDTAVSTSCAAARSTC
jgi:uncharacterized protein YjbI with pentapeptide repeats